MEALQLHAAGGQRGAAPVSARLAAVAAHDRRRTCSRASRCRRAPTCCWPVPAAPAPAVLEASRRPSRPSASTPEHESERPRFAYMPFAAGPRHCIGETLALYEMLMHLYKVARHYRLTLRCRTSRIELEAQINLRTRKPLHHEAGTPLMSKATHTHRTARSQPQRRPPHHLPRRRAERASVSFGELHARALGILYHLQSSARAAATS